jgi:hypothetical protein
VAERCGAFAPFEYRVALALAKPHRLHDAARSYGRTIVRLRRRLGRSSDWFRQCLIHGCLVLRDMGRLTEALAADDELIAACARALSVSCHRRTSSGGQRPIRHPCLIGAEARRRGAGGRPSVSDRLMATYGDRQMTTRHAAQTKLTRSTSRLGPRSSSPRRAASARASTRIRSMAPIRTSLLCSKSNTESDIHSETAAPPGPSRGVDIVSSFFASLTKPSCQLWSNGMKVRCQWPCTCPRLWP